MPSQDSGIIDLDFEGAGGGDFKAIPGGPYHATIYSVERKTSRSKQDEQGMEIGLQPFLRFTFKLCEDEGEYKNRRAWWNLNLQPSNMWRVKALLVELGYPSESLTGKTKLDLRPLNGRDVEITLKVVPDFRDATKEANEVEEVHAYSPTGAYA